MNLKIQMKQQQQKQTNKVESKQTTLRLKSLMLVLYTDFQKKREWFENWK
jgi:hypothetical protein